MQDFPHHYTVQASGAASGAVSLESGPMPALVSEPPAEFGGPGDKWSPEHLLVASVADCFVLTFRAIAAASRLEWTNLDVSAEGVLDKVERTMKFTDVTVRATLTLPEGGDAAKAERLLERAEAGCLITNSLDANVHLETVVN